MSLLPAPRPHPGYWFLWLVAFYGVWAWLVFGLGNLSVALDHWPIAVAMAAGSYAVGSTPMGGGTVGFPILVLLFDQPAQLGRDFSFAIGFFWGFPWWRFPVSVWTWFSTPFWFCCAARI